MKKNLMIALLTIALLPALAMAQPRGGGRVAAPSYSHGGGGNYYHGGGSYYHGGNNYYHGHDHGSFNLSLGFLFGGGSGYSYYDSPRYYAPAPYYDYYAPPYVATAPVVVYPSPQVYVAPPPVVVYRAPTYYYNTYSAPPRAYIQTNYYYRH